ncbi:glycosyltransferase [Winogradskyella sp.]|uniref:glycosyltransferase n=1 Tax=Winogradskyella sp. TaxID=1883156 RepID=UPI003BAA2033
MINRPLVTIICLCYNHEKYVVSALESVINQTYNSIELIIVDDASQDQSVTVIDSWNKNYNYPFIKNKQNIGNTKSFNNALKLSKGEFIVDLATDDILMKNSIALRLNKFLTSKIENLGVVYSNVETINENGDHIEYHFSEKTKINYPNRVPKVGNIYSALVNHYFINATSMLVKKEVFEKLNGYDENLSYEDFDFWIRSSRYFNYDYVDEALVKKRILKNSLGKQFKKNSGKKLNKSTLLVCKKIYYLNKTLDEFISLKNRLMHELRINVKLANFAISIRYAILLFKVQFKIWFFKIR